MQTDPNLVNFGNMLANPAMPVAQPVNDQPGLIGNTLAKIPYMPKARSFMSNLGSKLTGNNQALIKALAQGGNILGIMGSPYSSTTGDNRTAQMARLVASGAAGSSLAPPAQPQQTQPQAPTQPAEQQVPAEQPMTDVHIKGPATHVGKLLSDYNSSSNQANYSNFSNSTGVDAGSPVAAAPSPAPVVEPFAQNLNIAGITPEAQNLQDIGMLLGPEAQMDVYKQQPVRTQANANLLEAQVKAALAPSAVAKATAEVQKYMSETRDMDAKLHGLYNYSPDAIAQVEQAKETGKKLGEMASVEAFAETPLGRTAIDKSLRTLIPPEFKTYGDWAKANGSMEGIHDVMDLLNKRAVANIEAGGRIGAANKTVIGQQIAVLGQIETSLGQERRALVMSIKQREDPQFTIAMSPDQKAVNLTTVNNLKGQLLKVNALIDDNRAASSTLRDNLGIKTGTSVNRREAVGGVSKSSAEKPIQGPPPPGKMTVVILANGEYRLKSATNDYYMPTQTQINTWNQQRSGGKK
jgi:hypothetical protein